MMYPQRRHCPEIERPIQKVVALKERNPNGQIQLHEDDDDEKHRFFGAHSKHKRMVPAFF